jgi:hypothetical protein
MKMTLNEINTIINILTPFFGLMVIVVSTLFIRPFIKTIKEIF